MSRAGHVAGGHLSRGHVRVGGGHAVARGHVGGRGHPGGHSGRGPLHTRRQIWVVLLNISLAFFLLQQLSNNLRRKWLLKAA